MPERPTVLITRAEEVPGEDWSDYARCIEAAGGTPAVFDCAVLEGSPLDVATLPRHAGVLVTAGIDIDPARYGEPQGERVTATNRARDDIEGALIEYALLADVPLLCICRGFQLMNVVRGGSLVQHLEEREPHRARRGEDGVSIASGWHEVQVRAGSLLHAVTGREVVVTNSRHHQAVVAGGLAPDMLATGIAPDGVVEAIEAPGHPWALGVQWHPERAEMTDDSAHAAASTALFEAFV
ncbi:MAG: gamma-glutamyl-gamma-aminobutyrate hydrolase family protein, partial [Dehalococcoidia bacterium]